MTEENNEELEETTNEEEPVVNTDPLLEELEKRIPYDADIHGTQENYNDMLNSLLDSSKETLLGKLFPFEDFSNYVTPPQYNNWLIRCCVEYYNLADKQGVTSYAENGLSWTRLSDGLSYSLMNQIISRAGVLNRTKIIRKNEDEGE